MKFPKGEGAFKFKEFFDLKLRVVFSIQKQLYCLLFQFLDHSGNRKKINIFKGNGKLPQILSSDFNVYAFWLFDVQFSIISKLRLMLEAQPSPTKVNGHQFWLGDCVDEQLTIPVTVSISPLLFDHWRRRWWWFHWIEDCRKERILDVVVFVDWTIQFGQLCTASEEEEGNKKKVPLNFCIFECSGNCFHHFSFYGIATVREMSHSPDNGYRLHTADSIRGKEEEEKTVSKTDFRRFRGKIQNRDCSKKMKYKLRE